MSQGIASKQSVNTLLFRALFCS
jgi:hypothetical protein